MSSPAFAKCLLMAAEGMALSHNSPINGTNRCVTMRVLGECFAFDSPQLDEEARGDGVGWHSWLLRRVVVGLWRERKAK